MKKTFFSFFQLAFFCQWDSWCHDFTPVWMGVFVLCSDRCFRWRLSPFERIFYLPDWFCPQEYTATYSRAGFSILWCKIKCVCENETRFLLSVPVCLSDALFTWTQQSPCWNFEKKHPCYKLIPHSYSHIFKIKHPLSINVSCFLAKGIKYCQLSSSYPKPSEIQ